MWFSWTETNGFDRVYGSFLRSTWKYVHMLSCLPQASSYSLGSVYQRSCMEIERKTSFHFQTAKFVFLLCWLDLKLNICIKNDNLSVVGDHFKPFYFMSFKDKYHGIRWGLCVHGHLLEFSFYFFCPFCLHYPALILELSLKIP